MADLVTIMTFEDMSDLHTVRRILEDEHITCYVRDQYTIEAKPGSAGTYGGIKLQTSEDDAQKAFQILRGFGYFQEENETPSPFDESLDRITGRLPFLQKYPLQVKLLAIIFFIIAVACIIVVYRNL